MFSVNKEKSSAAPVSTSTQQEPLYAEVSHKRSLGARLAASHRHNPGDVKPSPDVVDGCVSTGAPSPTYVNVQHSQVAYENFSAGKAAQVIVVIDIDGVST